MGKMLRIAVVLSGCGVNDGAEIHEAVLTLLAIDRHGAEAVLFAPNIPQRDVVDHLSGKEMAETRNVLVESARIARGNISDLATFNVSEIDVIIFPGGFGSAKTLSSFASDGADCTVDRNVERAIRAMHAAKKPIGALCIAPALIAKVLGNVEVTIGNDPGTASAIEQTGARHSNAGHGEVVIDQTARVATTPGYMLDATISQIADGAENLVKAVLAMA